MERAQAVATCLKLDNPISKPSSSAGKRPWDDRDRGENFQPEKKPRSDGRNNTGVAPNKSLCPQCGKYHNEKCVLGGNGCFHCHEGHMVVNCPKFQNYNSNNVGRNHNNTGRGGYARALAMNQEEENGKAQTMSGILSVLNKSALVLFYSGDSHSLIAKRFYDKS